MNNANKYINSILTKLDLPLKEKQELKLQLLDHITNLQNNYISEGKTYEESLDLAIKGFNFNGCIDDYSNSNTIKLSYLARIISAIILIPIILLFIYFFNDVHHHASVDTLMNLIPFNFVALTIKDTIESGLFASFDVERRVLMMSLFIPVGFLLPIIINKINSCIPSLKIITVFIIFYQILDVHRNIDYVIFSLLAYLFGYFILNNLIKSLNLLKKKNLL